MIVKTGANYQAEGGYIEASKTETNVIVTIDGDDYNFKSDADNIISLYKTMISLSPELTSAVYCMGLSRDGDNFTPTGINLTNAPSEKYAAENVGIHFSIGGSTGINNPILAEGSRNTSIVKISASAARIYANGQDAVAIIKEGD